MINRYRNIFLVLIILLGFGLRFWKLGSMPALNADEADIAYNAYSLLLTGKDEHGNPWPIDFQSFNDYKPGFYFYLVLPFVKLVGLNEWAVRIPNASLGVGSILVIYLLVKRLFRSETHALVSALFLAISPWHIHFSRGGWEANTATFLILLGVYLFFKAMDNPRYYILSAIAFVLSLYTYHSARIVAPLLVFALFYLYRGKLIKSKKMIVVSLVAGLVLILPLAINLFSGNLVSRAAGVGIFADPGPIARINEQRGEHANFNGIMAKVLHNKFVNYSLDFFNNWGKHCWGEFLFLSGDDIQRDKVPEMGEMYLADFLFIIIGLYAISKKSDNWGIIICWLLIAPIAASLTFQSPHALRSENMVIPLVIISAYGALILLKFARDNLKSKTLLVASYLLLFIFMSWNFARYLRMYYVHLAKEYPFSSQYGVKELVYFIKQEGSKYDKIYVTSRYDQPYVLFLFYLKYPPDKFQGNHVLTERDEYGFSTVNNFDKYYFGDIDFNRLNKKGANILIAGTNEEIPDYSDVIKKIYFPNGTIAFKVAEIK
jgi:4-amino-4-deoxy-L-arabinose transferase-like glycosyltransferase